MPRTVRRGSAAFAVAAALCLPASAAERARPGARAAQESANLLLAGRQTEEPGPRIIYPQRVSLSLPLREIARSYVPPPATGKEIEVAEGIKNHYGPMEPLVPITDPVVQDWTTNLIPGPEFTFEGLSNADNAATVGSMVTPPDTNGDIGPNHYMQSVNLIFAVYNRAGQRLLGPLPNNALWAGFGGDCQTRNNGDPITLYDHLSDRWLHSQFTTAAPFHQCIAISQTGDPTGAWWRYDYIIPSGIFNDYPKFGVWPDAYYMSAGSRGIPGPTTDVFAFERDQMLVGGIARMVAFSTPAVLGYVAPMPADLDGPLPPAGAPNTFVGVKQSVPQALYTFEFRVDWTNPANSTFGLGGMPNNTIPCAPFVLICPSTRNCVPQPDTAIGVDALTGRYVMYRAQYRNFGTHESIVFNHTVDAGGSRAGVRWYEIRDPEGTPTIFQQGTYAPNDGLHRWMGSAAMDELGNLAIGYSLSSSTVFPSIWYAGRLAGDPPGELTQGEAAMTVGSGSQTSTGSRWGDYSMLAVDPVDDCTFWYTTEYYTTTSTNGWRSRIGRFRFPGCLAPDFAISANPASVSMPSGGSGSTTIAVQSINSFSSLVNLTCLTAGPRGLQCAFSPGGVTPPPNQSSPSTLTISADSTVRPGVYWILVEGTNNGVRRTAKVDVTVTP
jgi:hypothetical protein